MSLFPSFLRATARLREPFTNFLTSLPSPPLALVSDFFLGFTHHVATDAGVRHVVFHGMSCFSMAICKALITRPLAAASSVDLSAPFHVHGMPEHVAITADEIPDAVEKLADLEDPVTRFFIDEIGYSDVLSWGILVNIVTALDEDYVAPLESFWLAGPLFLTASDMSELEEEEEDPKGCLS
ncbi:unnamed protein product [Miscanthus lutarioriparius]|uniref:Uncharacterized protein n=1 Tax=Miscanthus lutarioriparius TaxID=422564 RepID=A0A811S983_9POAL|nr:unnamed protein product [Miscanthus lutarioriparius]